MRSTIYTASMRSRITPQPVMLRTAWPLQFIGSRPKAQGTGEPLLEQHDEQQEDAPDHVLPVDGQVEDASPPLEVKHVEDQPNQQHPRQRRLDPMPPVRSAPPTTAMAESSQSSAAVGGPEKASPARIAPAKPASIPLIAQTETMMRQIGNSARRAASSFPREPGSAIPRAPSSDAKVTMKG